MLWKKYIAGKGVEMAMARNVITLQGEFREGFTKEDIWQIAKGGEEGSQVDN